MVRFILTRAGGALAVVWLVVTVVFFALRIFSDPLEAVMGGPGSQASSEATRAAIEFYGFDQPLWQQYLIQLNHLVTWDFGDSYARNQPVWDLVGPATTSTLILAGTAFVIALLIALTTVYLAALGSGPQDSTDRNPSIGDSAPAGEATPRRSRGGRESSPSPPWYRRMVSPLGRGALSILRAVHAAAAVIPHFWLGATGIAVFSVGLGWLPATAAGSDPRSLILPSLTLGIPAGAYLAQIMDDALPGSHQSMFAFAARARGAGETQVLGWHSLRHLMIATAPSIGWVLGSMLSGAVVIETLMARPGLGRLMFEAALGSDIPLVIGIVTMVALIYVAVMLVIDILTAILDPRTAKGSVSFGRGHTRVAAAGEL